MITLLKVHICIPDTIITTHFGGDRMKGLLNFISGLLYLIFLSSCGIFTIPMQAKEEIEGCYSDIETGLDSLINIHGLYYIKREPTKDAKITHPYDTIYDAFIFHSKGFLEVNPSIALIQQSDLLLNKRSKHFKWGVFGCYNITGDTIEAKYVNPPGGMVCQTTKIWFRIIDQNSIERIYVGDKDIEIGKNGNPFPNYKSNICSFSPMTFIPSYNKTWLIKKKWFWADESEYKNWKRRQRLNK